jgi:hypothetical protein
VRLEQVRAVVVAHCWRWAGAECVADPSITLRVYAHVISEQLPEAAVIFARAIGSD